MRSLLLLALVALATLPLSAHDHGRGRRMVVIESPGWDRHPRWEARHWEDWRARQAWRRHHDCEDGRTHYRVHPRPLERPFGGRLELRFR